MAEYKALSRKEKSKLVEQAGIDKIYDLCQEARPGAKISLIGDRINLPCFFPGHADENPSCDIVFRDGRIWAKCFSCGQYASDPFVILQLITSIKDPLRILAEIVGQRFGVVLPEHVEDALVFEAEVQQVKEGLLLAGTQVLTAAAFGNDPEYEYAQDAVLLLKQRGVDTNMLPLLRLGAFPTKEHLFQYAPDVGSLAKEYLGKQVLEEKPKAVGRYGGWLMFPYYTSTTSIGRLKLRHPHKKSETRYLGHHRSEPRGFFGLHLFATAVGNADEASRTAYIVEGEFDQLSMFSAQQSTNSNQPYIVLGASGAGSSDLDMLADSSISQVVIVGDNDAGGDNFKKTTLRHSSQKRVRHIAMHCWPAALAHHNDPDEVVQQGDYAPFMEGLVSRADILELGTWAARQVDREVAALDVPRMLTKIDVANEYGQLISDDIERDLFVSRVAEILNIDAAMIAKHVIVNDTEEGFRMNIERCIAEYASPVASITFDTALLYSRTNKELFEVSLRKPRDIELAMQTRVFNMKAYNFIQAKIGLPDWITMDLTKKVPTPKSSMTQAKTLTQHFDWAMQNFVAQAGPIDQYSIRKQGVHWADAAGDEEDRERLHASVPDQRLYVVNGNRVFRGVPDENRQTRFTELDTPNDGGYLFWGDRSRRWCHATTAQDLERQAPMTPAECFAMLYDMINTGWTFRHQEMVATFLAGQLLTINASLVFDYLPFVFFTAPSHSGKSTLLKGLLGGVDPKNIGVLEQVVSYDDYTAAAIMQSAAGAGMVHCLDEWEDPDTAQQTPKGKATSSLLEMTRNLSAGMTRTRGTRGGTALNIYLRFPIFAAGIHPHRQTVDLNRWFTIEMDTQPGRVKPETVIHSKYTEDQITDLKHSLTLNAIQNAFVLKDLEAEVSRDFDDPNKITVLQSRFAKAMLSSVVGLRWAGVPNDMSFAQQFLSHNENYVMQTDVSVEKKLFRAVFETNAIKLNNDMVPRSVLSYLSDPDSRDALSSANCGVYYLPGTDVVVIYANKVREILRYNAEYRTTTNQHQIFSLLKRNPEVQHDPKFFVANTAIFLHLARYISSPRPEELLYVRLHDLAFNQAPPSGYVPQSEDPA